MKRKNLPTHLLLGAGAVYLAREYSSHQAAEVDAWQAVSASADFDQPYATALPEDTTTRLPG
jgi:hypothetical protein